MTNRKSQAVMEFLMTYGWTILVVLVSIVIVLAFPYFGVLSPQCTEKKDYNSGKLAQRCEDFCSSINLTCVYFNGVGCHDVNSNLIEFKCQRIIKNPIFSYYVN